MLFSRAWIPYYLLTLSKSKWFLTRKKNLLNINFDQHKQPMIKDKLYWKKRAHVWFETHELQNLVI